MAVEFEFEVESIRAAISHSRRNGGVIRGRPDLESFSVMVV